MEKNIEDMEDMDDELNDDLQMLGSFPVSESTQGTNINIDSSSTTFKIKNKGKSVGETKGKGKSAREVTENDDDTTPTSKKANLHLAPTI
ncbi:hypothetical protein C2S51_028525 [Perilla frutescens var. frutescens]|nr:hypothetical protein C2S51_028525 [Perilla frutescens var. frutescens]